MSRKMLFVFNPLSGKAQIRTKLMDILDIFTKAGYQIEVYVTQRAMDAKRIVEERGAEMDLIVGSGGDGTLNETADGAAGYPNAAVGIFPCGSGNDFIRTFAGEQKLHDQQQILQRDYGPEAHEQRAFLRAVNDRSEHGGDNKPADIAE